MEAAGQSLKFDLVSTWSEECGIFEYARALLTKTPLTGGLAQIFARDVREASEEERSAPNATAPIHRCWFPGATSQSGLIEKLLQSKSDSLWFQYHPSFFEPAALDEIAAVLPRTSYRKRVLNVHNHDGLAGTSFINGFTDIIVHNEKASAQIVQEATANVLVIPHFIYSRVSFARKQLRENFTIATVGLAAENKRVPLLIEAFSIAHALRPELRLNILTSPNPTHASHFELSRIVASIKNSSARSAISAELDHKSMPFLLSELSSCHLLCMPYSDSGESSSGAGRLGLSAGVPVLRSNSAIFEDFPGGDFVLEDESLEGIAEALLMLSQMPSLLHEKRAQIDDIYDNLNVGQVANMLAEVLI